MTIHRQDCPNILRSDDRDRQNQAYTYLLDATGQPVAKGQPLFEVYSPELVSAQREYAIAAQGVESLKDAGETAQAGMRQLAESSLARLRNWDISDAQIKALAQSGETRRTLTFRSPAEAVAQLADAPLDAVGKIDERRRAVALGGHSSKILTKGS